MTRKQFSLNPGWTAGLALLVGFLVPFHSHRANAQDAEETTASSSEDSIMSKRQLPDLPNGITSFGAAVVGERIYAFGGHLGTAHHYYAEGQNRDLLVLDTGDDSGWKKIAEGPGRQGLAMVAHGNSLYRVGGFKAENSEDEEQQLVSTADFGRFDLAEQKWIELPEMPEPRSSFDAVVMGDWLYIAGGWVMNGDQPARWLDSAYRIRLGNDDAEWERLADVPFRRRAVSLAHVEGKVYVVGGMQEKGGPTVKVAVYDPESNSWSEGPALPGESEMEGFGSSSFNVGGQLVVSTYGGNVYRLNSTGDGWDKLAELPEGRFFHRLLPLSRNEFILLGGANMETGKRLDIEVLRLPPAKAGVTTDSVAGGND